MSDDLRQAGEEALRGLNKKDEDPEEDKQPKIRDPRRVPSPEPSETFRVRAEGELTPEEATELRAKKKARVSQVLSRGVLSEKLQNILDQNTPDDRAGKYILDREEEIVRYQNLGYTFEYAEGVKQQRGMTGDGRIRVGDLVLMTISREDLEILREVRSETVKARLGAAKKEYAAHAMAEAERGGAVPFDNSQTIIDRR